jgi:hypothetical protein
MFDILSNLLLIPPFVFQASSTPAVFVEGIRVGVPARVIDLDVPDRRLGINVPARKISINVPQPPERR